MSADPTSSVVAVIVSGTGRAANPPPMLPEPVADATDLPVLEPPPVVDEPPTS